MGHLIVVGAGAAGLMAAAPRWSGATPSLCWSMRKSRARKFW